LGEEYRSFSSSYNINKINAASNYPLKKMLKSTAFLHELKN
jgi:hypothetical protein